MYGIHVRVVNDYISYKTVSLYKRGKARIWVDKLPNTTATIVTCLRCNKKYYIKYKEFRTNKHGTKNKNG